MILKLRGSLPATGKETSYNLKKIVLQIKKAVECGSVIGLLHEIVYRFVLRYFDKKPAEHV